MLFGCCGLGGAKGVFMVGKCFGEPVIVLEEPATIVLGDIIDELCYYFHSLKMVQCY